MEVENRMLEPLLVAKSIAERLERGINPRRLIQSTLREIMQNGALGVEIVASGKLAAKGARAKSIRKSIGYIPKAGDVVKLVNEAHVAAYPKYGAIGVKVRIVPPGTVFPGMEIKKIEIPKIYTYELKHSVVYSMFGLIAAGIIAFLSMFVPGILLAFALLRRTELHSF